MTILFVNHGLQSQDRKFSLFIEYSPNMSKLTDEVVDEKFKLSHNAVFRITKYLDGKTMPTMGVGFYNTGEMIISDDLRTTTPEIDEIKYIANYNYVLLTAGIKQVLGKYYVLPELGVGLNLSNRTKQITKYADGRVVKENRESEIFGREFSNVVFPLFVGIGREFKLGNLDFSTGIKGYYNINSTVASSSRANHHYGLGILLSWKIN